MQHCYSINLSTTYSAIERPKYSNSIEPYKDFYKLFSHINMANIKSIFSYSDIKKHPISITQATLLILYLFISSANAMTGNHNIDCNSDIVHCVSNISDNPQEFNKIQDAVLIAQPGDKVIVFNGTYDGFQIGVDQHGSYINGKPDQRITIKAVDEAVIINTPYIEKTRNLRKIKSRACGITVLFGGDNWTIDGFKINLASKATISSAGNNPHNPNAASQIGNHNGFHSAGICTDGHLAISNHINGLEIINNSIENGGDAGIIISHCENCLFENNTISGTYRARTLNKNGHGIYLANSGSDNSVIKYNTIFQNDGHGIHINGDSSSGGDGIITNVLIDGNTIYKNGLIPADSNGGIGINMDGVQDSTIINNLAYGNYDSTVKAYKVDGREAPKNLRIINNTFISNQWAIHLVNNRYSKDLGGHVIFNNILLGDSKRQGSISLSDTDIRSNYNILSNGFSLSGSYKKTESLYSWKKAIRQDTNSYMSFDGLFENPAIGNYKPKRSISIINRGTALFSNTHAPKTDINRDKRNKLLPISIGAYTSHSSN